MSIPPPPRYLRCTLKRGFTLIELSIVLVIIGLIVGGVLVGKDLIQAANMRSQISQIEQMQMAINTFKLKYNCLPGDCNRATQFFGATAQPEQVTNGNGDGKISGMRSIGSNFYFFAYATSYENGRVMDHLAAADMISLPQYDETDINNLEYGIAFPAMKYASTGDITYPAHYNVFYGNQRNKNGGLMLSYQLGGYNRANILPEGNWLLLHVRKITPYGQPAYSGIPSLEPWDAKTLDEKIDDGKPFGGQMRVANESYYTNYGAAICVDLTTNTYLTPSTLVGSYGLGIHLACGMAVKGMF